jgi:DNA-binding transcriptional LysR family regulator
VTQAAVTLQIRKLESELGVPLFHRTTRAVTLLEAGNRLLPYAQNMLKMADEAREQVRETKTEVSGSGARRIGAFGRPLRAATLYQEVSSEISPR